MRIDGTLRNDDRGFADWARLDISDGLLSMLGTRYKPSNQVPTDTQCERITS